MLPAEGAPFSPSEGERERYADTAAQTQEAEIVPPAVTSLFPSGGEGERFRCSCGLGRSKRG